jgi:hypothetical protein
VTLLYFCDVLQCCLCRCAVPPFDCSYGKVWPAFLPGLAFASKFKFGNWLSRGGRRATAAAAGGCRPGRPGLGPVLPLTASAQVSESLGPLRPVTVDSDSEVGRDRDRDGRRGRGGPRRV